MPELASLSKAERKRIWRACKPKAFRHWQTWLALLCYFLFFVAVVQLGKALFGTFSFWPWMITVGIGGVIGQFIFSPVTIHFAIPYIRQKLSDEDRDHAA